MSDVAAATAATNAPPPPVVVIENAGTPVAPPAVTVEPQPIETPLPSPTLLGGEPAAEVPAAAPEAEPETPQPEAEPAAEAVAELEPVSYEPFSFPEGMAVPADNENLAKFTEFATTKRLSQEDAQGLIDLYAAQAADFSDRLQRQMIDKQFETFAQTVSGWEQESRDAPEFQNRFNTVLEDAKWAIRELSGSDEAAQELRALLTTSGTGSHRAMIRVFANAAKRLKEARPAPRPTPTAVRPANGADRRYGRMG